MRRAAGKTASLRLMISLDDSYQVLLAGLAPGNWTIRGREDKFQLNARVEVGKNTALAAIPGGSYTVRPETIGGAFHSAAPLLKGDRTSP